MRIKNFTQKEYKISIKRSGEKGCPICGPHSGCNSGWFIRRNWKEYRITQYKL